MVTTHCRKSAHKERPIQIFLWKLICHNQKNESLLQIKVYQFEKKPVSSLCMFDIKLTCLVLGKLFAIAVDFINDVTRCTPHSINSCQTRSICKKDTRLPPTRGQFVETHAPVTNKPPGHYAFSSQNIQAIMRCCWTVMHSKQKRKTKTYCH